MTENILQSKVFKYGQLGAAIGVTIATFITLTNFFQGSELDIEYLTIGWACVIVSLRYFMRTSYTFSEIRSKCLSEIGKGMTNILLATHFLLILLTCLNTTILESVGTRLAVVIFSIQALIIILQWFIVFNPIFSIDLINEEENNFNEEKLKRKFIASHGLTALIDILTFLVAGIFIAMIWFEAILSNQEALLFCTLIFILVVLETAIHWITENEWATIIVD